MKSAPINVSAAGPNLVVPGTQGKRIRVVAFVLSFGGVVDAIFQTSTGNVAIGGPYHGGAGATVPAAPMPINLGGIESHFDTAQGDALNLNLSAPVAVGGHVVYVLEP